HVIGQGWGGRIGNADGGIQPGKDVIARDRGGFAVSIAEVPQVRVDAVTVDCLGAAVVARGDVHMKGRGGRKRVRQVCAKYPVAAADGNGGRRIERALRIVQQMSLVEESI